MQLLYGTTNSAKVQAMRELTQGLDITIISLNDLKKDIPAVSEYGKNPLDNAKIKAAAYYKAFGIPVFSCDSGLYFDNVTDDLQPGVCIRRVGGVELSDDEMIQYYSHVARQQKKTLTAQYKNAVYFIYNEQNIFYRMDSSLNTPPFILAAVPHEKKVQGFPLDSLSIDINTGRYFYDLHDDDFRVKNDGFRLFFEDALRNIHA